jgi:putative transposase
VANTYTQIYIPIVFAVQGRQNLIGREYNDELQKYMTGIVSGQGQNINNMPDHFHILIGQRPNVALSDLVRRARASPHRAITFSRIWKICEKVTLVAAARGSVSVHERT